MDDLDIVQAWENYGNAIEVVAVTATVLAKAAKAVNGTEGKVRDRLLLACNELHQAHDAATADVTAALRRHRELSGQTELFPVANGSAAAIAPARKAPKRSRGSASFAP